MRRAPWLTEEGYIDLTEFPIDSILERALSEDGEEFRGAVSLLASMHRAGRREPGVFLLGLLLACPDDWKKREEIVRALAGLHTKACADLLLGELRRVPSSNTTRRYLAAVLEVLARMPPGLVAEELQTMSEDGRFSRRVREKLRLAADGWLADRGLPHRFSTQISP